MQALSYVDQEYDHPMVKQLVDNMIQEEMKTFSPKLKDYLAHLPYPQIRFSSPALQTEFIRVQNKQSFEKFDTRRYSVDPPPSALEKDVQAWRSSISNAKSQLEHQSNRLLNLELCEKRVSDVWLFQNSLIEKIDSSLSLRVRDLEREIGELNAEREREQQEARVNEKRCEARAARAVEKSWAIHTQCQIMRQRLGLEEDEEEEKEKDVKEKDENKEEQEREREEHNEKGNKRMRCDENDT